MATKSKPKPKPAANGVLPQPADVLTLPEAAAFLRVPEAGLLADAEAGRVPGRLVGGEWRFSKPALLDWLSTPPADSRTQKQRISALIGAWKDDPTAEAMIEAIYDDRKRHPIGGA